MSAQLAGDGIARSNSFTAHLALAAGVTVSIHAPTLNELQLVVTRLQPAANDIAPGGSAAPVAGKPAATPAPSPTPQAQPEGNASASTGTQAGAQGASAGSTSGGEAAGSITYKEIADKVTSMVKNPKIGRDATLALLGTFKGMNGQACDHGAKLQLPDYPAFIAAADKALLAGAAK